MSATAGSLPAGLDIGDVRRHSLNVYNATRLVNATMLYLAAEDGSQEEREAERALTILAEEVEAVGDGHSTGVALVLASIIVDTADEERVQSWVDDQQEHLRAVLSDE